MDTFNNETVISKYKKEVVLGNGSFGTVYLVKLNKTFYVLKEINMNTLTSVEKQRAFNEVSVLAKLKHRNIIEYKDSMLDHISCKLSIVMDYANSGDLAGAIVKQKGVPFSVHKTISWFVQISLALQYIHSQNILHRDLKTQNIFLSGENTIKVGDFGISRLLKNSEDFANTRIGTPLYLSPEVYMGKPYNRKSDMWALGCVLFEISTLERAFKAETLLELTSVIVEGKRQPFPNWMKSGSMKQLVEDLLRFNPDQRPSTDQVLVYPTLKPYLSFYVQKEISPSSNTRSPENDLKRSASVLNSNNSKLHKLSSTAKQRSTRAIPPAIIVTEYQGKFEANEQSSASTRATPPTIVVTENETPNKFEKQKRPFLSTRVSPSANVITKNKTTDKFEKNKRKERFGFSRVTALAIENITPDKFLNSKPDISSKNNMNITYTVEKKTNAVESSKPYALCPTPPYDIDCGYSSEEISCTTDSTDKGVFEHTINDSENKLSIREDMKHESAQSNQTHCGHSQCHQCMIDMMWKNRIRGCVSVSRSKGDYLKLKKKLLLIFGCDLFQKVYESLLHEWEGNESSYVQTSIQSFAKLFNYEQVQHLPLMMQLIQLDLVKLSKNETYSNELVML